MISVTSLWYGSGVSASVSHRTAADWLLESSPTDAHDTHDPKNTGDIKIVSRRRVLLRMGLYTQGFVMFAIFVPGSVLVAKEDFIVELRRG